MWEGGTVRRPYVTTPVRPYVGKQFLVFASTPRLIRFFRKMSGMFPWRSCCARPNLVLARRQIWPPSAILYVPVIASFPQPVKIFHRNVAYGFLSTPRCVSLKKIPVFRLIWLSGGHLRIREFSFTKHSCNLVIASPPRQLVKLFRNLSGMFPYWPNCARPNFVSVRRLEEGSLVETIHMDSSQPLDVPSPKRSRSVD